MQRERPEKDGDSLCKHSFAYPAFYLKAISHRIDLSKVTQTICDDP